MSRVVFPLLTSLLFSGSYIAGKYTTVDVDPVTTTLVRYVIATVFLAALFPWFGGKVEKTHWRSAGLFVLLGLFGIAGYNVLFFMSLHYTEVANTAIINATSPVITGVLAALVSAERLTFRGYGGIGLTVIGVMVLLTDGDLSGLVDRAINVGDLLMLAAVFCWAVYALLIKHLSRRYTAYQLTLFATISGVLWLIIACAFIAEARSLGEVSRASVFSILYMGVAASGVGYLTYNLSVASIGATRTSGFVYGVIPIWVAVLAWAMFSQALTMEMVLSTPLIVAGVWLMLRPYPKIAA